MGVVNRERHSALTGQRFNNICAQVARSKNVAPLAIRPLYCIFFLEMNSQHVWRQDKESLWTRNIIETYMRLPVALQQLHECSAARLSMEATRPISRLPPSVHLQAHPCSLINSQHQTRRKSPNSTPVMFLRPKLFA